METQGSGETLDIPLSVFDGKIPRGFGMDIGGTLTKVAYATTEGKFARFHFITYPKYEIQSAMENLKEKLSESIKPEDNIFTTGFGCNEFEDVINDVLGVKIANKLEMDCNAEALKLLVNHLPLSQYVYPKPEKVQPFIDDQIKCFERIQQMMEQDENSQMKPWRFGKYESSHDLDSILTDNDVFPCLICTLGSGAFYCTMEADGSSDMIDINTSCGRMLMGLGSLLTGVQSFDELMELAESGDDSRVETKCKHVKGSNKQDFYSMISDDTPIYCFGQTPGKQISDFRREDLAAAVVSQLAQNMAQSCHLANMCCNVKMIFFCGSVCTRSEFLRGEIAKHFTVKNATNYKNTSREFYFLKYGGHVGALGALLLANKLPSS